MKAGTLQPSHQLSDNKLHACNPKHAPMKANPSTGSAKTQRSLRCQADNPMTF